MPSRPKKLIGSVDKVDLPDFGVESINAKVDTGAHRSAMHCKGIVLDNTRLRFKIQTENGSQEFSTTDWVQKKIRSSNGKVELRYVIKTKLRIFGKNYLVSFSLSDRSKMKYPLLLGKEFLSGRFLVDVSQKNISFKTKSL